jgi:hypothetical protein
MSFLSWTPLARRIGFLCGVALLTVGTATAQSLSSPNPTSSGSLAAGESSPRSLDLTADEGFSSSAALPADPAEPGSSAAAASGGGQNREGRFYSPSHIAIDAGAGFNAPIGNDIPYITWGGNFTIGGGLHFSKQVSALLEYQLLDDKLPGAFVALGGGTSGDAHIWSLTLDPVIDLAPKRTNSIYVTGGGGFYRKVTSFTVQVCCDFYGYTVPEVAAHFSSNQGGVNAGFGLTHRVGGVYSDGTMKLFAEARYLYVKTPETNAFTGPLKMGPTELIPVSFGVRW